jgi:hypothetical protein
MPAPVFMEKKIMKTAYFVCTLAAALFFAACGEFFNAQSGEGTFIYIPPEGAAPSLGSSFNTPAVYPGLESPRIGVYNPAGKLIREAAGSGKLEFTVPAGGPYWIDFSAAVSHPRTEDGGPDTETDNFPFVKSFGATVKIEKVRAGSSQEISLPLRVRETAIMVPYSYNQDKNVNRNVFVPVYDLPGAFPGGGIHSIDKGIDEICFDFDPFGRLFAMEKVKAFDIIPAGTYVCQRDNLSGDRKIVNTVGSFGNSHGLAFNLLDGYLYYSYRSILLNNPYYLSVYDVSSQSYVRKDNSLSHLSSAIITIDDEGILYGVTGQEADTAITVRKPGSYWKADGDGVSSLFIKSIFEKALPDGDSGDYITSESILDLKALNGYLYMICRQNEDFPAFFAAVPLEAVRTGNPAGGAWFVKGLTVDDLATAASDTLEGFLGARKFAGWGPDRLYVYDTQGNTDYGTHRIVEVDLGNRRLSKAGMIAGQKN